MWGIFREAGGPALCVVVKFTNFHNAEGTVVSARISGDHILQSGFDWAIRCGGLGTEPLMRQVTWDELYSLTVTYGVELPCGRPLTCR